MVVLLLNVSYNNNSLANFLLFIEVAIRFLITLDTKIKSETNVYLWYGTNIQFNKYSGGLYYFNTKNMENNNTNNQVTYYYYLNTLQSRNRTSANAKSKKEVHQEYKKLVEWPLTQVLKKSVFKKKIRNCPVTIKKSTKKKPTTDHKYP